MSEQPAQQAQPARPASSAAPVPNTDCSPQQAVTTAIRLKHVFDMVASLLTSDAVGQIWVVYGTLGGQLPRVQSVDTKETLYVIINDLRAKHNTEPDSQYFIHIFYGQRWQIQKGRVWQLWDGNTLEPISAGIAMPYLDLTGLLGDHVDPDKLVATKQAQPTAATAAVEDSTDDTDDMEQEDFDVVDDPPLLGEMAPPGEDAEID